MRYLLMAAALLLAANTYVPGAQGEVRVNVGVPVPYFFSPEPCRGCYHGQWQGREGYHRGGGEPWARDHREGDHRGGDENGRGGWHGGHDHGR